MMVEGPRILIIDDSLTVRMDLGEALTDAGLDNRAVSTLQEARHALLNGEFRLLILDVHLPDGDGIAFLQELRQEPRFAELKVMLLSTENEVGERIRGLRTGADEYLGKPYDTAQVCDRAADFLREPSEQTDSDPRPLVLLIEDSDTFRHATEEALTDAGFRVITADNGEDGLRMAARRRPAAVVVDGQLPGIDGATVVRRLRVHPELRATALVLLTGTVGAVSEVEGLDAGADAYLQKSDSFDLLLARLSALLRNAAARKAAADANKVQPRRVLAVDDSPTFLNALADDLRTDGYDVATASSGEEALRYLEQQSVDAVLLDLMMPGLSGLDVCRLIKRNTELRETPVMILTGTQEQDAVIAGLNAGADDYIVKSSDLDVLRSRLAAQLRRKQFEDEARRNERRRHRQTVELAERRAAEALADARARLLADLETKNRELEQARAQAEEASRFKSDFLATMSHEIRTPMNAILGFTELLVDEETDPAKQEMLRIIRTAGVSLLNLINDILDFSKIEAGKLQLSPQAFDVAALLQRVADLFALKAREKQLTLSVELDDALPRHLIGDDQRLFQVITNLVGNAIKFTEQGQIVLSAGFAAGRFQLEICDSGIGMSETQQQRLFQPFEQADRSTTRKYGGTGLGLAICKNLIELMDGVIDVRSALGQGSVFRLDIPLPIASAAQVGELEGAEQRMPRGRVSLLLEQAAERAPLLERLREWRFVAQSHPLQPDPLPVLSRNPPDALLFDAGLLQQALSHSLRQARLLNNIPWLWLYGRPYDDLALVDGWLMEAEDGALSWARRLLGRLVDPGQGSALLIGPSPALSGTDHDHQAFTALLSPWLQLSLAGRAPAASAPDFLLLSAAGPELQAWMPQLVTWLQGEAPPQLLATPEAAAQLARALGTATTARRENGGGRERIAQALRRQARRAARGELLIKQWRDSQPMPELVQLVENGISRLLRAVEEIAQLLNQGGSAVDLHRAAHSLKGWVGTLRMEQVYQPAERIDTLACTEPVDWLAIGQQALQIFFHTDCISRRYLEQGSQPADAGDYAAPSRECRVLVVEDNEMNQQLMHRLLSKFGFAHDVAENGAVGLQRLRQAHYDLVLLDMEMPVMDGRQAIREIRADPVLSDLPVIALTAHAVAGAAQSFIDAGCNDYLSKPIDADLLMLKVQEWTQESHRPGPPE
ncbi:response regulator [Pseudomarimonas arenosa]|uniref:Sensory/regulatory protein RpfC n=1 Tax=Pseudomarimonas arenosa TaxID=2774145 RepID=A0AAW3ZNL6_9GAMM|nr:response regulator [Pseudomarimonas arenosa]MBD8526767.1 response regulator [Pseudomarimonas arenosa]